MKSMIAVLGFVVLVLAASTLTPMKASAASINCMIVPAGEERGNRDYSAGVVDVVRGSCGDAWDYSVEFIGGGIGLRTSLETGFVISCPFSEKIEGTYGGIKADASVMIGFDAAILVGSQGPCILGGVNLFSLGANVSFSRMKISRKYTANLSSNLDGQTKSESELQLKGALNANSPIWPSTSVSSSSARIAL